MMNSLKEYKFQQNTNGYNKNKLNASKFREHSNLENSWYNLVFALGQILSGCFVFLFERTFIRYRKIGTLNFNNIL